MKAIQVFVVLLVCISGTAHATSFTGKLVKVIDGDTVEVLHNGKAERIRLAQIDAPEQGQPFGQTAKRYVLDLAAQKIVTVQVETVDRYGRTVAEIFLPDSSNLNKQIVRSGYAWEYKRYSTDPEYGVLEKQARSAGKGLWQEPNPVPPWEWRKGIRQVAKSHTLKADFTCSSKRYCKEMTSCVEAKFYLNQCGLERLDGDSDGVPCESFCK